MTVWWLFSSIHTEYTDITSDMSLNNSSSSTTKLTNEQIQGLREALNDIIDDITEQLNNGDQKMISGVKNY